MALTDLAIKNAKPRDKPYKLGDSGGLYLQVEPSGGRLWRQKYWFEDREKVAKAFIEKRQREGMSKSTVDKSGYYISRLGPSISRLPVAEITTPGILDSLRRIEAKGNYETARRVLQLTGRVFRYAVATARLTVDPTRVLRGALTAPQPKHYGAIIEPKRAGELLRAIDGYEGQELTKLAMQLSPHVFVRPGELRHAEWADIDLEAALWTIPIAKMKMRRPHHVPLSRQSVQLLRLVNAITGPAGYAFPSTARRLRACRSILRKRLATSAVWPKSRGCD